MNKEITKQNCFLKSRCEKYIVDKTVSAEIRYEYYEDNLFIARVELFELQNDNTYRMAIMESKPMPIIDLVKDVNRIVNDIVFCHSIIKCVNS